MRKNFLTLLAVLFCGCMLIAVSALTAADVPDQIIIKEEALAPFKKGPVKFDHKKHSAEFGAKCTDCHHVMKDGKNVWKEGDPVQKCSVCHAAEPTDKNLTKLQNAFHKNCKDCHKEKNDDEKAPFKKCAGCHEKG